MVSPTNIFKAMDMGAPNGFNPVFQGKDVLIGVSKIVGKWPFPEWSRHDKDELLIVIKGQVEVEYENKSTLLVNEGELEVMPKHLGHKVHSVAKRPSEVLLIFADKK